MQVFNQFNARLLLDGEFNVFQNIFGNPMYVIIQILVVGVQLLMVEYGGMITKTVPLTTDQNLVCIAISSGVLVWGVIIKFIPLRFFGWLSINENPEAEPSELVGILKKSTIRKSKKE